MEHLQFVLLYHWMRHLHLKEEKNILLAAERNGETVDGFELGNSPFSYSTDIVSEKEIVLTTTNGTKCLNLSLEADKILIGSILNLDSIVEYLKGQKNDCILFSCGWKGNYCFEDVYAAGAIGSKLKEYTLANDAVSMASSLYLGSQEKLLEIVKSTDYFKRLKHRGIWKDIEYCLQESIIDIVPIYENGLLKLDHII